MRLPGNKWHARKHPSHTCKHVLPGSGRSQTARPLTDRALNGNAPRGWRKIHLGIDEQTLEVRAVHCPAGDLHGKSAERGDHREPHRRRAGSALSAQPDPSRRRDRKRHRPLSGHRVAMPCRAVDGAYDTRKCHDAIADRGTRAVIPPRKNAKPWKTVTAGAVARNEALRASKYLGRAIWRNMSGYHRRSRVETNPLEIMLRITLPGNGCTRMKLLGQRLMARDFDRPVAEVQVRIAVMNGYTALGIPVTEAVG
jgi:hypothetical protein